MLKEQEAAAANQQQLNDSSVAFSLKALNQNSMDVQVAMSSSNIVGAGVGPSTSRGGGVGSERAAPPTLAADHQLLQNSVVVLEQLKFPNPREDSGAGSSLASALGNRQQSGSSLGTNAPTTSATSTIIIDSDSESDNFASAFSIKRSNSRNDQPK